MTSAPGAVGDFLTVWRNQGPVARFVLLGAACLPAGLLIIGIIQDVARKSVPPPPEVLYVESWRLDRSMDDILKDQKIRQDLRAKKQEEVRQRYIQLGRASGMDVDAILREAEAEKVARAADEARKARTETPAPSISQPAVSEPAR